MGLKAVFLDFSGVIFDDEAINQELVADILLNENLRPDEADYNCFCRGRSDRACLKDLLANRGRILSDTYLDRLLATQVQGYRQKIDQLAEIIIAPHLEEFLLRLREQGIAVGIVTGATRSEVTHIIQKLGLAAYFDTIVAGDDLAPSKPEPEPYLLAMQNLKVQPAECLAIENNPVGITAAKQARIQVVGISSLYPLHMLQRQANWTVDNFLEIELERVDRVLSQVS